MTWGEPVKKKSLTNVQKSHPGVERQFPADQVQLGLLGLVKGVGLNPVAACR